MELSKKLWSAKEWARVKASGDEFVELVHQATNEEKWGPTGEQMENVCRAFPRGANQIMDEITRRLKHRDKSWRPCYKVLLLLDYLARNLPEVYLADLCSLLSLLRTISQNFFYTNSKGIDHGISVRERAKNLADLLSDGALLRQEREKFAQAKTKLQRDGPIGNRIVPFSGGFSESYGGHPSAFGTKGRYDSYRRPFPGSSVGSPLSRAEQERQDAEFARRLQIEEEARSGLSVTEIAAAYSSTLPKPPAPSPSSFAKPTELTDEQYAWRIQEEELARAEAEGSTLKKVPEPPQPSSQTTTRTAKPKTPETSAAAPANNLLDDLFAPVQGPGCGGGNFDPFATHEASSQAFGGQPPGGNFCGPNAAAPAWGEPAISPAQGWGPFQQAPGQPPGPTQPEKPNLPSFQPPTASSTLGTFSPVSQPEPGPSAPGAFFQPDDLSWMQAPIPAQLPPQGGRTAGVDMNMGQAAPLQNVSGFAFHYPNLSSST